jgi:CHAD domain-containing protein
MAYRLKAGRALAKSILGAGVGQIDRAAGELSENSDPHEGVHQARKAFKRMRALLLLIRPIIGEKAHARENKRYRRLGQRFSGARDAQALLDAVFKLEARYGLAGQSRACSVISERLREERSRAEQALAEEHTESGLEALRKARRSFARLSIQNATLKLVGRGLEEGYREGRRCFVRAYARGDDEAFHDWRKAVQRHWRHLQLVSPAWPEALKPRILLAQELSQLLGDDHDLAVLRQWIPAHCAPLLDEGEIAEFEALCQKRQSELRSLARGRGQKLFGEKPRAFRRRITNYWLTSLEIAPLTDVSVDTDHENGDAGPRKNTRKSTHKNTDRNKIIPLRK